MPIPAAPPRYPRFNPLGLWFCALATLGFLRVLARKVRQPDLPWDLIAWLWLGGSVVLSLLGIVLLVQGWRRGR